MIKDKEKWQKIKLFLGEPWRCWCTHFPLQLRSTANELREEPEFHPSLLWSFPHLAHPLCRACLSLVIFPALFNSAGPSHYLSLMGYSCSFRKFFLVSCFNNESQCSSLISNEEKPYTWGNVHQPKKKYCRLCPLSPWSTSIEDDSKTLHIPVLTPWQNYVVLKVPDL